MFEAIRRPPGAATDPAAAKAIPARQRPVWDEWTGAALRREKIAYGVAFAALALAGFGLWQASEQYAKGSYIPVVVERDPAGRTAAMYEAAAARPGEMTPAMVRARALVWLRDCRAVYSDAAALRKAITNCYALTERGSAAWNQLYRFHNDDPPHERAGRYTLVLERETAVPDAGQTLILHWDERRRMRDGADGGKTGYRMRLTYKLRPPQNTEETRDNPEGWWVTDYSEEAIQEPRGGQRVVERAP